MSIAATPPNPATSLPGESPDEHEYRVVDLGRFLRIVWRARYWVVASALLGGLLAYGAGFLVKPRYDATTRLMPPDHKESLIASLSPSRNEGDLYLGLLSSRTVADDVIAHLHLDEYFKMDKPYQVHRMLDSIVSIMVDKNQFITITARDTDPEMAMKIANEYPQALYRLNHAVAISQAAHRREYFEAPLEQERDKLAEAEEQLKRAQLKTGIVAPQAQVQLGLSSIATLQGQITARQAELAALETGSTDQNPQVIQLKREIGSLNGELGRLQAQNRGGNDTGTDGKLPTLTLDVVRLTRDVAYHESLLQTLSKQYENARIEDSYSPPIELVDAAVLPELKAWPQRRLWAEIGFILGFCLSLLLIVLRAVSPIRRLRAFFREEPAPGPQGSHV